MPTPNPLRPSSNKVLRYLGLTVQLGLTMAVSVLLGFYLGWLADRQWSTDGTLLAVGTLLGVFAGGLVCYRTTLKVLVHPDDETGGEAD